MRATAFLAVSMLSVVALGCNGAAGELSGLVCDCEHCNDWEEEETLEGFLTEEDVADAYGCADLWDTYMTCRIDNGTCNETDANWEVPSSGGSCSATMDTGQPCMMDADCNTGPGNGTCSAMMTCVVNTCAGVGIPCDNNGDCPGNSPCANDQTRLNDCVQKGSAHNGPGGP